MPKSNFNQIIKNFEKRHSAVLAPLGPKSPKQGVEELGPSIASVENLPLGGVWFTLLPPSSLLDLVSPEHESFLAKL